MLKLVRTSDHDLDAPSASLVNIHSRGLDSEWARHHKTAAVLTDVLDNIQPEKGKTYIHVLALGATERYGPNRNGDGFKRADCQACHGGFVKSGRFHKNHDNKDPEKAIGSIPHSAYNDEMDRVELIAALDNEKCANEIQKLSTGKDLCVSMGCLVAHDVCSICGHKAPSPKQYCDHAKFAMTQVLDDGRQIYVDNPNPNFFECSSVGRGADRNGLTFRKVASADLENTSFTYSTDLAKAAGLYVPARLAAEYGDATLRAKLAVLERLAEIEKQIETNMTPLQVKGCDSFNTDAHLSPEDVKTEDIDDTLGTMHAGKVVLPVEDFLTLISAASPSAELNPSELAGDVESSLGGVFSRLLDSPDLSGMLSNGLFDGAPAEQASDNAKDLAKNLEPDLSLAAGPMTRRVTISIVSPSGKKGKTPKAASAKDPLVEGLANLYATYKLAMLMYPTNSGDTSLYESVVLHNYA